MQVLHLDVFVLGYVETKTKKDCFSKSNIFCMGLALLHTPDWHSNFCLQHDSVPLGGKQMLHAIDFNVK